MIRFTLHVLQDTHYVQNCAKVQRVGKVTIPSILITKKITNITDFKLNLFSIAANVLRFHRRLRVSQVSTGEPSSYKRHLVQQYYCKILNLIK